MVVVSISARKTWRKRRVTHLAAQVAAGEYSVPSVDVAHAILFGRPKWGDDPISAVSSVGAMVGSQGDTGTR